MTVPEWDFRVLSQAHNSTGIALGRIRDAAIAASQRACQTGSRRSKGQVRARALARILARRKPAALPLVGVRYVLHQAQEAELSCALGLHEGRRMFRRGMQRAPPSAIRRETGRGPAATFRRELDRLAQDNAPHRYRRCTAVTNRCDSLSCIELLWKLASKCGAPRSSPKQPAPRGGEGFVATPPQREMLLMNNRSAVARIRPLHAQEDTLSANFTLTTATASHSMSRQRFVAPPLVRELRQVVAELQEKNAAQERQIKELRGAIVALMEPDMRRILRTPGGIMVLDRK